MTLFKFKMFRTSYFFPRMKKAQEDMYDLYPTYGGYLIRIYIFINLVFLIEAHIKNTVLKHFINEDKNCLCCLLSQ